MKDVDFLPEWYRRKQRRRDLRISRIWLGAIGLCALGIWFAVTESRLSEARGQLEHLTQLDNTVQAGLGLLSELQQEQARLTERYRLARELGPRISCVETLATLAEVMPVQVALEQLYITSEKKKVAPKPAGGVAALAAQIAQGEGAGTAGASQPEYEIQVAIVGLAATEMDVAILVGQLSSCPEFREVRLEYCTAKSIGERQAQSFRVTFLAEPKLAHLPWEEEV